MKRIYRLKYLILAICVLISDGCDVERSSHSKALSAIDSMDDVSPRRALAMLDSIGRGQTLPISQTETITICCA